MVFISVTIPTNNKNYITGYSKSHQQQFCGEIRSYDSATGLAIIDVKNKFSVGDKLELILPEGNQDIIVERMEDMHGHTMQEASGGGYEVKIPLPEITVIMDCWRVILAKAGQGSTRED